MQTQPAHDSLVRRENLRRRMTARMMRGVFRAGHTDGTAPLPRIGIHRILICRSVHTLGDSLTLTPLLSEIAEVFPGAEIDIVSGCPLADVLFERFPGVRHIHRIPRYVARHLLATARTLRAMRRKHYDLVIDPDPHSQSGRLLALAAHARHSLGYTGPQKSGTLSHGVPAPGELRHKAMTPVYLLRRALGEDPAARPYPQPSLLLTDAERASGRQHLARLAGTRGPCIGVFANATRAKLLAGDWWKSCIAALQADLPDCRIVEILPDFGKSMLDDRFPCFYSSDIRKLAALLASLDAYISADCGVMHLAWAAGAPTAGLFNVTDPAEWGPFGARAFALQMAAATPQDVAHQVAQRLAPYCAGAGVTAP